MSCPGIMSTDFTQEFLWDGRQNYGLDVLSKYLVCYSILASLNNPKETKSQFDKLRLLAGHSYGPRRPTISGGNGHLDIYQRQYQNVEGGSLHENQIFKILSNNDNWPDFILQLGKVAFGIHGIAK